MQLQNLNTAAGQYDPKERCTHLANSLRSIQQLHNEGIVHLDVKPENILLSLKEDMLLCDFAGSMHNGQPSCILYCTPRYGAPEVIAAYERKDLLDITPANDAYSAAIMTLRVVGSKNIRGSLRTAVRENLRQHPQERPGLEPLIYELEDNAANAQISRRN